MDGEAEALGRQVYHQGCAVRTEHQKLLITDCQDPERTTSHVFRRSTIVTREEWNASVYSIHEDGIVYLAGPHDKLKDLR